MLPFTDPKDIEKLSDLDDDLIGTPFDLERQKLARRFIKQYMRYGHLKGGQKKAAIEAGYEPRYAHSVASRLLARTDIQEAIAYENEKRTERLHCEQDRVLKEVVKIAFADINDILTWEGDSVILRDSAELSPEETAVVNSIIRTKVKGGGYNLEVKMHDKLKALDMLCRANGMYKDKGAAEGIQIGGVLRVPNRKSIDEWEQDELQASDATPEEP